MNMLQIVSLADRFRASNGSSHLVSKPFSVHPCARNLTLSFDLMAVSSSKARRLRVSAVKRKLWHYGGHGENYGSGFPVRQSSDVCVEMARQILSTNAFLLQWLMEYSSVAFAVPMFCNGMVIGSSPAEGNQCKADIFADSGGSGHLAATGAEEFGSELGSGSVDVVIESGAPDTSTDTGGAMSAEPGSRKANVITERGGFSRDGVDGETEHGEGTGEVTMDMVKLELQHMAANLERVGSLGLGAGGFGDIMRKLHEQLDEVREQMVTRDSYDRLLDRLRQLELGVGVSVGAGVAAHIFDDAACLGERSGYTDCEDYDEEAKFYGEDVSD